MATAAVNMSSTMTTSSMTSSSHTAQRTAESEDPIEEHIQKMQSNLIRYTRANDRRMVLRSLKDVRLLSSLPLDPVQEWEGPLEDLEAEIAEETVLVNGIPFKPIGMTPDGKTRALAGKEGCLAMLKGLLERLCDRDGVKSDPNVIYESLVIRMGKTAASADPYFRMNALFGSSDLLVMPLTPESMPQRTSAVANNKEADSLQTPINLHMYEAHNEIHMTLSQTYKFGLFRKSDVKPNRPWIVVDSIVTERANFSNGQSTRQVCVKLPELY